MEFKDESLTPEATEVNDVLKRLYKILAGLISQKGTINKPVRNMNEEKQ